MSEFANETSNDSLFLSVSSRRILHVSRSPICPLPRHGRGQRQFTLRHTQDRLEVHAAASVTVAVAILHSRVCSDVPVPESRPFRRHRAFL